MSPEWIVWSKEGLIFIFSIISLHVFFLFVYDSVTVEKNKCRKWHFLFTVCHLINRWFDECENEQKIESIEIENKFSATENRVVTLNRLSIDVGNFFIFLFWRHKSLLLRNSFSMNQQIWTINGCAKMYGEEIVHMPALVPVK